MRVTREEGQKALVLAYVQHRAVLALYATGFGKAKASLDAVMTNGTWNQGLIVTHSENARDITWPQEIEKWCPDLFDHGDVAICCYQALAGLSKGQKYDWVIFDEAHYITPHNYQFINDNQVDSVILLTATEPEDSVKKMLLRSLTSTTLEITLDDAIKSNVLNDYRIVVWNIAMTPSERGEYLKLCSNVTHAMSTGNSNFIKMRLGERMRFIYNLESKLKAGIYLRDQIRMTGRRNIIFCGSIEMADKISPYRYHSQVSDTDYKRFLRKEISELASIKQIQEGANIEDLESALVLQLNSKQLGLIQKLGRQMRLEPGKIARMHIVVAKDSVDTNWASKALKGLDKTKITYRTLDPELYM